MEPNPRLVPAEPPDPDVDNSMEAQVARHFAEHPGEQVFPLRGDDDSASIASTPASSDG